jgi:hypothetical protein
VTSAWRRLPADALARVRREGRPTLGWSLRLASAATLSYVVATLIFPGTQPLLAPLTAMLVVQVTPVSLLASGLDRVVAVVSGLLLAVAFATVVPLEWWSLAILLFVALTVGQILRLRSNLVEVAISAMLVLGVGAFDAGSAAWQRFAFTIVGAVVGILANLVWPPRATTGKAGDAINGLADAMSELLVRAADGLDELASDAAGRTRLRATSRHWLGDARKITHDIPEVGAALIRAEEGRRLNVRAVRRPQVEPGLRQGLEALEHAAVAIRVMMRALADASDGDWLEGADSAGVLTELAESFRQMAAGIDAFGELVHNEGDAPAELSGADIARLRETLDGLHEALGRIDRALTSSSDVDVVELHTVERATVRRLLRELALDERVRRELRLQRRRRRPRPPVRRRPRDLPDVAGPDDETRVLPVVPDEETR